MGMSQPSNDDLPKHQSISCPTSPDVTSSQSQFDKKSTQKSNLAESSEDGMNEEEDDASFHSCSSGNNDVGSLLLTVQGSHKAIFPLMLSKILSLDYHGQ